MKKIIRHSLIAASLVTAGAVQALDFQTAAGSSFTNYFSLTTTASNSLVLSVSGLDAQYQSLDFEILSGGPSLTATAKNGNLVATFNDVRNGSYALNAGTYTLKVTGVTESTLPGTFGRVSISASNGTVTPVPEPESYALMLAGLGLMGTMVRRRSKAAKDAA